MARRIEKTRINFNGKMVSICVDMHKGSGYIKAPVKGKIVWATHRIRWVNMPPCHGVACLLTNKDNAFILSKR
jgi:hypothetical protein